MISQTTSPIYIKTFTTLLDFLTLYISRSALSKALFFAIWISLLEYLIDQDRKCEAQYDKDNCNRT